MTCQELDDRLDDWVDDTLPDAQRREVEAHLAACADCREQERRLRELLTHAAALPRSVSPPRDLWPGIAEQIERRRAWSWPRFAAWQPALAVAATVVIALGAVLFGRPGAGARAHGRDPEPGDRRRPGIGSSRRRWRWTPASWPWRATTRPRPTPCWRPCSSGRTSWSPRPWRASQRNLAVIDEALAEVHRALEKDPNRPELGRMLVSTHRKRVEVLRKMVKLSTTL